MRCFLAVICIFVLSGCTSLSSGPSSAPAPIISYGGGEGVGSAGAHIVDEGDTAYDIAKRYNVPLRDLLDKNRLSPPYRLNVGERVILPPPTIYQVRKGDNLHAISRIFDVSVTSLARINNMRSPFVIHEDDRLRLPYQGRGGTKTVSLASSQKTNPDTKPDQQPKIYKAPARSSGRFHWPVSGRVISNFGPKKNGLHNDGINIKAPRGAPVRAAENGVVVYAGDDLKGYGNLVLLKHADGWVTAYAHLDKMLVSKGKEMRAGQTLGTIGSTGQVDSPQLHFEIRKKTSALNPAKYLSGTS